jgi:uncharacterized tellurite resistance protein B-like protein
MRLAPSLRAFQGSAPAAPFRNPSDRRRHAGSLAWQPSKRLMLQALKSFLDELGGGAAPRQRAFEAGDYRLAAAALLVHLASIDGEFADKEKARLQQVVEARFGLDYQEARELIENAWESEREAVDLFRFTSVLKRTLDEQGRREVVALLWDMAYTDGTVHEFEENIVWRVAELLGVSTRDRVGLRQGAKDMAQDIAKDDAASIDARPPLGPWSKG